MTVKELKKKYKGYGFIAYGKPLANKEHMTPFDYTYNIKNWDKAIVLDYEVEEYDKPHAINHFSFPEVKYKETTYEIGMVYAYVKEGEK